MRLNPNKGSPPTVFLILAAVLHLFCFSSKVSKNLQHTLLRNYLWGCGCFLQTGNIEVKACPSPLPVQLRGAMLGNWRWAHSEPDGCTICSGWMCIPGIQENPAPSRFTISFYVLMLSVKIPRGCSDGWKARKGEEHSR